MARVNNLLKLVPYNNQILRKVTEAVEFPLNDETKQLIADMIYSIQPKNLQAAGAPWDAAVGMAANQWGVSKRIFLYCPTGDTVDDLEVVINPSYEPILNSAILANPEPQLEEDWEGCFSVPLCTGHIRRYLKIRVQYQNEAGETIQRELSGWEARVWQHENDHLDGFLYDDPRHGKCIEKKEFPSVAAVDEFYDEVRKSRKKK